MAPRAILVLVLLLAPVLTGCLTSESVVRIRADGSGTIETVFLVNEEAMANVGNMFGGDAKGSAKSTPTMSFDPATLQAQAATYGDGVRLVSSEPMTRGALKGARMVYAFDDVNRLRIDRDPMSTATGAASSGASNVALRLDRQPNGHAVLSIDLREDAPVKRKSQPSAGKGSVGIDVSDLPPEMEAMFRELFDGFRIAIDIEVDGTIVQTSSPFANGSRVTMLEMDLGALLKDKAGMVRLMAIPPGTAPGGMATALKDVKGIKVNDSPLTIEFAAR